MCQSTGTVWPHWTYYKMWQKIRKLYDNLISMLNCKNTYKTCHAPSPKYSNKLL